MLQKSTIKLKTGEMSGVEKEKGVMSEIDKNLLYRKISKEVLKLVAWTTIRCTFGLPPTESWKKHNKNNLLALFLSINFYIDKTHLQILNSHMKFATGSKLWKMILSFKKETRHYFFSPSKSAKMLNYRGSSWCTSESLWYNEKN